MHSRKIISFSENTNTPGLKSGENSAPPKTPRDPSPDRRQKYPRTKYDAEQLALFAAYIPNRAYYRPRECREDIAQCWVRLGPPAFSTNSLKTGGGGYSRCIGCGGTIMSER